MTNPAATVVITTKNRRGDLRRALDSVMAQRGAAIETIVIDDGSDDGTAEMVRATFPTVQLEQRADSRGYIVRRNEAARLAAAPVIVSIDDDATFPSPDTIAQTLAEFDSPVIGAVAIPFINVKQDTIVRQRAPDDGQLYEIFAYIGTAHAVRRDLFNELGGYREFFFHQNEEMDFCIRLMDAGYVVRVGRADAIHHFESPRRINSRMFVYGRRNDVLFSILNVPFPDVLVHIPGTIVTGFINGCKLGHPWWTIKGVSLGLGAMILYARSRNPVSRIKYRRFRKLKSRGPAVLSHA